MMRFFPHSLNMYVLNSLLWRKLIGKQIQWETITNIKQTTKLIDRGHFQEIRNSSYLDKLPASLICFIFFSAMK